MRSDANMETVLRRAGRQLAVARVALQEPEKLADASDDAV
jgi:hypothetical protein